MRLCGISPFAHLQEHHCECVVWCGDFGGGGGDGAAAVAATASHGRESIFIVMIIIGNRAKRGMTHEIRFVMRIYCIWKERERAQPNQIHADTHTNGWSDRIGIELCLEVQDCRACFVYVFVCAGQKRSHRAHNT